MIGAKTISESGNAPTWARGCDWQTIDRALRSIAERRAGLDAEEARWLREAAKLQIWRELGMVSALDYMERVMGYGPRAAQERLRVARKLAELPETEAELERGAISFSAVRELSRVATRWTESEWLVAADHKNLREIEELVAGHVEGDLPDDPPDERARKHVVSFEVDADTFALLRQLRAVIDAEHGERLDDSKFVAALVARASDGEPGRARTQVAVTVCERCGAGWQDGGGAVVRLSEPAVERARCDAQHIGSLDAPMPARAYQDVTPAVERFVRRRDHGRCRVPGCRSARGIEIHHIEHQADGGSHEPINLVSICSSCHIAHHEGRLFIAGTSDDLVVTRPSPPARAHVGAPMLALPSGRAHVGATLREDATLALTTLGWKRPLARRAVERALDELGPTAGLEPTIRKALQHCS